MTNIYLLTFTEHGGDIYSYYTTNKEWFDWIGTKDDILPEMMVEAKIRADRGEIEIEDMVDDFSAGSFENDRALTLRLICDEAPEQKKDLVKWLTANNFEIEDEYDGLIY